MKTVIRVLIYEGGDEWIRDTLNSSAIPINNKRKFCINSLTENEGTISSIVLDPFPDTVSRDLILSLGKEL